MAKKSTVIYARSVLTPAQFKAWKAMPVKLSKRELAAGKRPSGGSTSMGFLEAAGSRRKKADVEARKPARGSRARAKVQHARLMKALKHGQGRKWGPHDPLWGEWDSYTNSKKRKLAKTYVKEMRSKGLSDEALMDFGGDVSELEMLVGEEVGGIHAMDGGASTDPELDADYHRLIAKGFSKQLAARKLGYEQNPAVKKSRKGKRTRPANRRKMRDGLSVEWIDRNGRKQIGVVHSARAKSSTVIGRNSMRFEEHLNKNLYPFADNPRIRSTRPPGVSMSFSYPSRYRALQGSGHGAKMVGYAPTIAKAWKLLKNKKGFVLDTKTRKTHWA